MSETQQTNVDVSGVTRQPDGTIANPSQAPETKTETKPIETKPSEPTSTEKKPETSLLDAKTEEKKEEPKGAPEKYEDFKAPEGYELDKDLVAKALPIFKELGLSQDQGQKLVDFYAEASKAAAEAPVKFWEAKQQEYRAEVIKDKDLGNGTDGLKPEVKQRLAKTIDALGPNAEAFREFMNYSGAGNHISFIRAFDFFSKFVVEGGHVSGTNPSKFGQQRPGAPDSAAKAFYPNLA